MGSFISKNKPIGYYSSFNKDIAVYQKKQNNNKWLVYSDDGNFVFEIKKKFDIQKDLFYGCKLFKNI